MRKVYNVYEPKFESKGELLTEIDSRMEHILFNNMGLNRDTKFYVAGGCLTSLFCGDSINDVDVFFESELDLQDFISKNDSKFRGITIKSSPLAYTLKVGDYKLQLFHKFFLTATDMIFLSFDFIHVMCAYIPNVEYEKRIVYHPGFKQCCQTKQICFNFNAKYTISSLFRVKKLLGRGWNISTIEFVKMALHVRSLKIESFTDLADQLEGLDSANLAPLYEEIKALDGKPYNFEEFVQICNKDNIR